MAVPINILFGALFIAAPLFCQSITIDSGSPSDQYFTGGATYAIATPGATGDLTLRYGAFAYNIPAPAGNYTVSLFMRETGTGGTRRFSVAINGASVLQGFDLFAIAGLSELQRDFPATSTGTINISFTWTLKSAVVSRIVVTPVPIVKIFDHASGLLRIDVGSVSVTGSPTSPEMKAAAGWVAR